ncbi:hypothetical protein [Halobacillus litoralis]|uniref:Lipoprotein n=1 Tax=Halobacillus litoralis TaxID=45668 RepID=A0A410MDZ7_9BACI|nr:hypothetical protein [Halobacillus litoralis]QAS52959.1 hypothetical protein HLI_12535 [Halobacillus litoralis]
MKKFGLFVLILIVTSCQSGENSQDTLSPEDDRSEEAAPLEEKYLNAVLKETTFTFQGESYPANYHVTCLNETACEAPSTNNIESYTEWKEEVDPVKIPANIGDEVTIDFPEDVPDPERLNIQKQQGATGRDESMENKTIEIMGKEGTDIIYIVRAEWFEGEKKTAGVQFAFIVPAPEIS